MARFSHVVRPNFSCSRDSWSELQTTSFKCRKARQHFKACDLVISNTFRKYLSLFQLRSQIYRFSTNIVFELCTKICMTYLLIWKFKIPQKYFIVYAIQLMLLLAIIKFPVLLKIQCAAYTHILPLHWWFHLRDNCVLSKEFYPLLSMYLRPGRLFMTSNSMTFYAVFSACSTKKLHASTANFLSKLFEAMISETRVQFEWN